MFAVTVTIGRISAGKSTFLIRLPPEMSTPDDSISDDANHVHGRGPQNMNNGEFSNPRMGGGNTKLKTEVEDRSRGGGVINDQKSPRTDPRYRAFNSRATRLWIRPR